jgi:molybdate/tungstate transport system ATP-binding protein
VIRIENLSNNWDDIFSLKDINLTIQEGEYFVILGPTGSGKTLLLELIAGIYVPDEGTVTLGGVEVTQLPPERRPGGRANRQALNTASRAP